MIIALAMLAVLGQSASFSLDNIVHKSSGGNHHILSEVGTSCTLYLKHGYYANTISITGGFQLSAPSAFSWAETHWHTYTFASDYVVSVNIPTWFYTACANALLADSFYLNAQDGTNSWGGNGQYAWCLSTDSSDASYFNNQADSKISGWTPVRDTCYSELRLTPNGVVKGWTGSAYVTTASNRRALQEIPTGADVLACEEDETTTDADCAALVDQILDFHIANPEGYEVAQQVDASEAVEEETSGRRKL